MPAGSGILVYSAFITHQNRNITGCYIKPLLLSFTLAIITCGAFAQDACKNTPPGATLPDSSGCIPLTYKPLDGGPERTVWAPAIFQPSTTPIAKPSPMKMRVRELEIGAVGTYADPDFNPRRNGNVGGFAAFNTRWWGVEADGSFTVASPTGIHETTGAIGPRVNYTTKYVTVYGKAQVGGGSFSGDPVHIYGEDKKYILEQYGAGVDIRVMKHLKIRAVDASYQVWPTFPPHNLTPILVSSGLAYTF